MVDLNWKRQLTKRKQRMANGNGNGRSNGNDKNGAPSAISLATLISLAVLILGMVGFWWNQADPRQSLADIRKSVEDLRKLHTDDLAQLYKHLSEHQVTLREHNDLATRSVTQDEQLNKKIDALQELSLTKAQFEAWRIERDQLIALIQKRIDNNHDDTDRVEKNSVSRAEMERIITGVVKVDDALSHRLDIVSDRFEKFRESVDRLDTPLSKLVAGINEKVNNLSEAALRNKVLVDETDGRFRRNEEWLKVLSEKIENIRRQQKGGK